jgi:transcriptional regulator with XRE-family HTH domain
VPPNSEFGRRLTDARQKRGLTQVQLAELIGSTQRAISRYETVADFPPTAVVLELAKVLDISADELLGIKPPKTSAAPKQDPETKRLWKKFQQVRTLPEKRSTRRHPAHQLTRPNQKSQLTTTIAKRHQPLKVSGLGRIHFLDQQQRQGTNGCTPPRHLPPS